MSREPRVLGHSRKSQRLHTYFRHLCLKSLCEGVLELSGTWWKPRSMCYTVLLPTRVMLQYWLPSYRGVVLHKQFLTGKLPPATMASRPLTSLALPSRVLGKLMAVGYTTVSDLRDLDAESLAHGPCLHPFASGRRVSHPFFGT